MSTEENKSLARRFQDEFVNTGNVDILDELMTPDAVLHLTGLPAPVRGREAFKQLAAGYYTAFPDLQEATEDEVAEGDKVVRRVTWRGTHQGEFGGIPPTGKPVTVTGMRIFRIEDGKIAEEWAIDDALGMMQQLGVIPAPGSVSA